MSEWGSDGMLEWGDEVKVRAGTLRGPFGGTKRCSKRPAVLRDLRASAYSKP